MTFSKFQEYLDTKAKLQTSGNVKLVADYEGKEENAPVKEKKDKDAGGVGQTGTINPYKGGVNAQDPNKNKLGDGFADKGDQKLKYNPDVLKDMGNVSSDENGVPGGKKSASWPKTKTQEWIDRTKDLSLAEFTREIRTETQNGLSECACQDAPNTSISDAVNVCKCNKNYVSSLVREMKRQGLFGKLVQEMVQHPETFKALTILMAKNEAYAQRFAKAMNEMVSGPMGDEKIPSKIDLLKKKHHPDMEDDDLGMDLDDEVPEDDLDAGMDDMDSPEDGEKLKKLPLKKHAHSNLLGAMKKHPALSLDGM